MLQKELTIQNTKLLLKLTISNLKKTWANTALLEFGLAKSDIRQLPKVKFKDDFVTIFDFTLPLLKALSQDEVLQCQNGAMTHISRKTKRCRQHALFL